MKKITSESAQKLYHFLSACGGNWRNTIYISGKAWHTGWLMAADRDGAPVILSAADFQEQVQEQIIPSECRGYLTESAFADIFARYIPWKLPDADSRPSEILNLLSTSL